MSGDNTTHDRITAALAIAAQLDRAMDVIAALLTTPGFLTNAPAQMSYAQALIDARSLAAELRATIATVRVSGLPLPDDIATQLAALESCLIRDEINLGYLSTDAGEGERTEAR